jgi:putative DNA-invertase from lambdoid prophage Rac
MQAIYSRVSTDKQDASNQLSKLMLLYPEAETVVETASGSKARPLLTLLLARLQKGDTLIVAALDRLGRSTIDLLTIIEALDRRGVNLKSIREGVEYNSIAGKLIIQVLCAVAEMERSLISERTKTALQAKKRSGVKLGRKPTYTEAQVAQVLDLRQKGMLLKDVSRATGISLARCGELCSVIGAKP